jgi:hypothetical protein
MTVGTYITSECMGLKYLGTQNTLSESMECAYYCPPIQDLRQRQKGERGHVIGLREKDATKPIPPSTLCSLG